MLYRRKCLPTGVTLGSLRILNKTPPALSLRSATSASRRSASDNHGAKLNHSERHTVLADAFGAIEDRSPAGYLHRHGSNDHDRRCSQQCQQREANIECALLKPLGPLILRLVNVD